mmetsp:Transcript_10283/g.26607  ORF Transcript_10283/g.26607 Transcript_10283/m.26607 type:complete len:439 (-) Transcript_10283:1471-2787(-)
MTGRDPRLLLPGSRGMGVLLGDWKGTTLHIVLAALARNGLAVVIGHACAVHLELRGQRQYCGEAPERKEATSQGDDNGHEAEHAEGFGGGPVQQRYAQQRRGAALEDIVRACLQRGANAFVPPHAVADAVVSEVNNMAGIVHAEADGHDRDGEGHSVASDAEDRHESKQCEHHARHVQHDQEGQMHGQREQQRHEDTEAAPHGRLCRQLEDGVIARSVDRKGLVVDCRGHAGLVHHCPHICSLRGTALAIHGLPEVDGAERCIQGTRRVAYNVAAVHEAGWRGKVGVHRCCGLGIGGICLKLSRYIPQPALRGHSHITACSQHGKQAGKACAEAGIAKRRLLKEKRQVEGCHITKRGILILQVDLDMGLVREEVGVGHAATKVGHADGAENQKTQPKRSTDQWQGVAALEHVRPSSAEELAQFVARLEQRRACTCLCV